LRFPFLILALVIWTCCVSPVCCSWILLELSTCISPNKRSKSWMRDCLQIRVYIIQLLLLTVIFCEYFIILCLRASQIVYARFCLTTKLQVPITSLSTCSAVPVFWKVHLPKSPWVLPSL
jgi:hypothetical protein